MAGLEVAAANQPRYQFLVYNASVHHWRVVAPLHRDGLRHHLLASTERVVQVRGALARRPTRAGRERGSRR